MWEGDRPFPLLVLGWPYLMLAPTWTRPVPVFARSWLCLQPARSSGSEAVPASQEYQCQGANYDYEDTGFHGCPPAICPDECLGMNIGDYGAAASRSQLRAGILHLAEMLGGR